MMQLPFSKTKAPKRRDQVIAVDLGGRTTKAVSVQRRGDSFVLTSYAVLDAPVSERSVSAEVLSEHLKTLAAALEARCKAMSLAISVNDSVVRQAELPAMPLHDLRMVLKTNSKLYLQQDYPNHTFDCYFAPNPASDSTAPKSKATGLQKQKVLVAGAKSQLLDDLQDAVKGAGFVADQVVPNLIGPINAFEFAQPEDFAKEVVALIDIGFSGSSISLLQQGDLVMTRVLATGSDQLTSELAESLGISYAEAEGIKVGMPTEVEGQLAALIGPLGRELRASMDFYEHQNDRPVTRAYVSGGAARSELILQLLQQELMTECKPWNPTGFLQISVPPQQAAELEQISPQLAVAVGTAMATL
jgi:type IV pilus assembly protein PilM